MLYFFLLNVIVPEECVMLSSPVLCDDERKTYAFCCSTRARDTFVTCIKFWVEALFLTLTTFLLSHPQEVLQPNESNRVEMDAMAKGYANRNSNIRMYLHFLAFSHSHSLSLSLSLCLSLSLSLSLSLTRFLSLALFSHRAVVHEVPSALGGLDVGEVVTTVGSGTPRSVYVSERKGGEGRRRGKGKGEAGGEGMGGGGGDLTGARRLRTGSNALSLWDAPVAYSCTPPGPAFPVCVCVYVC
jgi:hypothetical protein